MSNTTFICQYGNCEETDTPILLTYRKEERPRFCCAEHTILWLLDRDPGISLSTYDRIKEQMERDFR